MDRTLGIFTGAGISTAPPASLPTGDRFHGLLLRGCRDAARRYAPRAVSAAGLHTLLTAGRRNILGCIEDCLPAGTTAGVLDCMRVTVPTEAHLLCAVHAASGARLITVNFDNGIELAHELLTGAASLPPGAPAAYREALAAWRRHLPDRTALQVLHTPAQLARHDGAGRRPTLVKLRGSVGQGADSTVIPLRPACEDMESTRLDDDRFAALAAVAGCDHLVVTGHSGRDLDCFESLRTVLRPGHFSWVVPEIEPSVAGHIAAIDGAQPQRGTAERVLRSLLPDLPPWPRTGWHGSRFAGRFRAWWSGLPERAAAEAYAWMLALCGRFEEPIAILHGLLHSDDSTRLRLRLADVLVQRGHPADLAEASRIYTAALGDPQPYPWFHVETRRAEAGRDASLDTLAMVVAQLAVADPVVSRAAIQCVAVLSRLLRDRAGAEPPPQLWLVLGEALRLARERAGRLGIATRQSHLELETVAVAALSALDGGPPLASDTPGRLAAVERAFAHRGDAVGGLRVASVRALVCLAGGNVTGAGQAVDQLLRVGDTNEYHHIADQLAAAVRRIAAAPAAARKVRTPSDARSTPQARQRTGGRRAAVAADGQPPAGAAAAARAPGPRGHR